MRKLFTLAAAMLACLAINAQSTIFLWQYDGSSVYGDGSNNGIFDVSGANPGTIKFVTYEKKKTSADGTSKYDASVTDPDLKPNISKVSKLGNNGAHFRISPASGTFQAGDTVFICGYLDFIFTTSSDPTSTAKISTADGGATVIAASVSTGTGKGSCKVGSFVIPEGFKETNEIYVSRVPSTSAGIAAIKVVRPSQSPYLKAIKIANVDCNIVKAADAADPDTIRAELPYGTIIDDAINAADITLGGSATSSEVDTDADPKTLTVFNEGKSESKVYVFDLSVDATISTDATLKSLSLNGVAVDLEDGVFEYNLELPYADGVAADAVANDVAAQGVVADLSVDGVATITVTAQAGNTQVYVVNYTFLPAKKDLLEAKFSNGAKGAITNGKIRVPYLEGEAEPTFESAKFWNADGTPTAVVEGSNLKVTGVDGLDSLYALEFVAITPAAVEYDKEITFDSTETYIFSTYGFDKGGKGWRFAKATEEATNKRVSDGRSRLYFALPAAGKVILTTSDGTGARKVKIYVNGVESSITKIADKNKTIELSLNPAQANFVAIESDQQDGDGGFSKMTVSQDFPTAIDNTEDGVKAVKVVRDGQLLIIKGEKTYNIIGVQLR